MKIRFFLLLLWFPGIISAQDTIFVKNGNIIPAIIVSKDNTVVKYRSAAGTESTAVHTIFVSDIKDIHYANGRVDNMKSGNKMPEEKSRSAFQRAGEYNIGRISFGAGPGLFVRSNSDNLNEFWSMGSNRQALGGNPVLFRYELKMSFVTSYSKRSWVSCGLQVYMLQDNAIYATGNNEMDKISFTSSFGGITLNYGYAFNAKKNLVAIFDPGIDFSGMDGYIKISGITYDLYTKSKTGWHLGTGIDWLFSKIFHASLRAGYRFSKPVNENHFDYNSPTHYSHFNINGNPVQIKWNGPYVSLALSASVYFDALKAAQRGVRPKKQ